MAKSKSKIKNLPHYDVIVFKEDNTYVAYCPELDISSCGNSVEHAKEMHKTAVKLFIEEAEKMGSLEDILERRIKCLIAKKNSTLTGIITSIIEGQIEKKFSFQMSTTFAV